MRLHLSRQPREYALLCAAEFGQYMHSRAEMVYTLEEKGQAKPVKIVVEQDPESMV